MPAPFPRPASGRAPGSEDGFTLVEVLVAAFILVLGALGVFMTLAAGIGNVQRAKSTQVAIDVAQLEMERLRSVPYDQLAHDPGAMPAASGDPASPASRVRGSELDLERGPGEDLAPFATAAGGVVVAGPVSKEVDGTRMGVYSYVAQIEDQPCSERSEDACELKRVTVAVWLQQPPNRSYRPNYYELQSDFTDPAPEP